MDKKSIPKIIIGALTLFFLIFPLSSIHAEDYPAGYTGPGYRKQLSEISTGYPIATFQWLSDRNQWLVNKRNEIENMVSSSYQAGWLSADRILGIAVEHINYVNQLNQEIAESRQQREKTAAAEGEFNYIPYSDGKKVYFKDNLVTRIENERVVDEVGNVSYRNSYNYQYNDKRLLTAFEADTQDRLGNNTHTRQSEITYTADSLFYATNHTNANKNVIEYFLEETDHLGNSKATHFFAGSYEGKLLRAFSQNIEDSVSGKTSFTRNHISYANNDPEQMASYHETGVGSDGLDYVADRTDISVNERGQLSGYREVMYTTQIDGTKTKTTTAAKFTYLDTPGQFGSDVDPEGHRLLESKISVTTENADGSMRIETDTIKYAYKNYVLGSASGQSTFNGQAAKWYEYTDASGHILSKNTDENGKVTYSYVDPDTTQTIAVSQDQVRTALKDGNKFSGSAETQFEILYGRPLAKQTRSLTTYYNPTNNNISGSEDSIVTYNNGLVSNLLRVLDTQEHTVISSPLLDPENTHQQIRDIATLYSYDAKANLSASQGSGTGSGWEYASEKGWYGKFNSTISIDYQITLGKALRKTYHEDKDYQ